MVRIYTIILISLPKLLSLVTQNKDKKIKIKRRKEGRKREKERKGKKEGKKEEKKKFFIRVY